MNEHAKDRLADWVAGRLEPDEAREIEAAVRTDPELAAEAELLRSLFAATPAPPADLSARIVRALEEDREMRHGSPNRWSPPHRFRLPRWALAAAAIAAVALGSLEVADRVSSSGPDGAPLDQVALEDAPSPWVADDGFVAGAAMLDELSDEALSSLLEELEG